LTFVVTAVLALWTVRRNEDYRSAVSLWETVASNAAHNQRAFINLGIAYVKEENNLSAAQEALERALILKPGNVRALVNLAGVYMERGQPKEAIAKLEKVLAVEPDNAEVICNIGVALSAGGDLKGARAHVERAVSIDPAYAQGHNNLGVILMKSGKLTAAARAFERALEIDREYREARSNLESVQRRLEGRRARRENAGSAPPLR
jgi:Tfp pilus assembly protein PilF